MSEAAGGTGRTVLGASSATLIARIIGFVRNIALAAALGTGIVADSYNLANQVPNQIFLLLGGGTIAAVFLPQLARLAARSQSDADRYGTVLLFGSAAFGMVVSSLLMAFAPTIVRLLGGSSWGASQQELTVALFLWCIPQVAAYSIFAVASQIMNSRGKFALVGWLPAVSSTSVIIGSVIVIVNGTVNANDPEGVSPTVITLLGATTLGGTALQVTILIVLLRQVGFRFRFRGGLRRLGLRAAISTGILAVAAASCYQATNLITAAWTAQAGTAALAEGFEGVGYSAFFYAMALMSVVQGVAVASLASIILQRLSRHYADGNTAHAHRELEEASVRLASFVVPTGALFVAVGPALADVMFARGETSPEAARLVGVVLALLATGMLPFSWHSLLIRPFYARRDALRPFLTSLTVNGIWTLGAILSFWLLPPQWVVFGMAATFSISYWIDLPLKLAWLRRRVGFTLSSAARRGVILALCVSGGLSLIVGIPGWSIIFLANPGKWEVVIITVSQVALFVAAYALAMWRTALSPVTLLQWLRK